MLILIFNNNKLNKYLSETNMINPAQKNDELNQEVAEDEAFPNIAGDAAESAEQNRQREMEMQENMTEKSYNSATSAEKIPKQITNIS